MDTSQSAQGLVNAGMSGLAAFGGPALQGGMALMGFDPLTMGVNAAMSSFMGGASISRAAMAGMGAGALPGMAVMGATYVGEKMYSGMQQQNSLNNTLRANYTFPTSRGYGFSSQDMSQIGSDMRAMTHQFGPQGEMTSMRELTAIAGKMGQMGMTTGVRDAQQFSDKLKKTVDTLKQVATTLNTSLEGALDFVNSTKSSGMFRAADQAKFASTARNTAVGAGVAMSEVTAMANIGSQISRSVGGLGRQGAFGGMQAMNQVGSSLQSGAISEEDVYNATGLTGAEGRQALATGMMQQSARFYSSGRGRRFLASIAGKDGSLNEQAVAEYMTGGVTTGRTMELAHQNLGKVGRANFIRNEGRLRGAALEKFGALGQTMAYKEWLESRGYDPNDMDDKAMLAFQRFSGMSRDEADVAVKMVSNLPQTMREERERTRNDQYLQKQAAYRKTQGIEGAKLRFQHAREKINSKIESVGQEVYNDLTGYAETLINKLLDQTVSRATEDVDKTFKAASMGGAGGKQLYQAHFGGKKLIGDTTTAKGGVGSMSFGGYGSTTNQMEGGSMGATVGKFAAAGAAFGIGGMALAGAAKWALGPSGADKYKEAGFDLSGATGTAEQRGLYYEKRMGEVQKFIESAQKGDDRQSMQFGTRAADMLRTAYSQGGTISGSGENRVAAYQKMLESEAKKGNKEAAAELERFSKADMAGRAGMMSAAEAGAGINEKARLANFAKAPSAFNVDRGKYSSLAEGDEAVGEALGVGSASRAKYIGAAVGGVAAGIFTLGAGSVMGAAAGSAIAEKYFGGDGGSTARRSAGAYMRSKEGISMASGLFAADDKERMSARKRAEEQMAGFVADEEKHKLSDSDRGRMEAMRSMMIGSSYAEAVRLGRSGDIDKYVESVKKMGGKYKDMSREDIMALGQKSYEAGTSELAAQQREEHAAMIGRVKSDAAGDIKSLTGTGLLTRDEKTGRLSVSAARMKGASAGTAYLASYLAEGLEAGERGDLEGVYKTGGREYKQLMKMSAADKRDAARRLAGTDVGMMAAESLSRETRMKAGIKRGGAESAVASELGLDLSKDELAALKGMKSSEASAMLQRKLGIQDETFGNELSKSLHDARRGKVGKAGDELVRGIAQSPEAQKKIAEEKEKKADAADPQRAMARDIKAMADAFKKLTPGAVGDAVGTSLGAKLESMGDKIAQAVKK